eukprot:gnl/TRDRNA2_/TRDRNA2_127729_c0_seq1.p1 gnl/TRDRNA2_/TRDRNA2_127729_c0~~gnl/TRDRNA2_/TRDRNA2_127729_c0_seq1.p1  ORF type:complete len:668 (+),score=85.63 gnl/TRDRNA2_/TRDRNA2_127729_c0_seq1:43-2046(+)
MAKTPFGDLLARLAAEHDRVLGACEQLRSENQLLRGQLAVSARSDTAMSIMTAGSICDERQPVLTPSWQEARGSTWRKHMLKHVVKEGRKDCITLDASVTPKLRLHVDKEVKDSWCPSDRSPVVSLPESLYKEPGRSMQPVPVPAGAVLCTAEPDFVPPELPTTVAAIGSGATRGRPATCTAATVAVTGTGVHEEEEWCPFEPPRTQPIFHREEVVEPAPREETVEVEAVPSEGRAGLTVSAHAEFRLASPQVGPFDDIAVNVEGGQSVSASSMPRPCSIVEERGREILRRMSDLRDVSQVEAEQVVSLARRCSFPDLDPVRLLRFLRGTAGDVDEAASHVRSMREYRDLECIGSSLKDLVSRPFDSESVELLRDKLMDCVKVDACQTPEGHSVRIELDGRVGISSLLMLPDKTLSLGWYSLMELSTSWLDRRSRSQRQLVKQVTLHDLSGLRVSGIVRNAQLLNRLKVLFDRISCDFPETAKAIVVFNAPRSFLALWRIISKFLHEATRAKVHILGADFAEQIAAKLGSDALVALAGLRRDVGDGLLPKPVPEGSTRATFPTDFAVPAGQMAVCAGRQLAGTCTHWAFDVAGGSATFSATFFPATSSLPGGEAPPRIVVASESLCSRAEDCFTTDTDGVLWLVWSNLDNWWVGAHIANLQINVTLS